MCLLDSKKSPWSSQLPMCLFVMKQSILQKSPEDILLALIKMARSHWQSLSLGGGGLV